MDLNLFWKCFEWNGKQKKKKNKEQKKVKGRGTESGPGQDPAHGPPGDLPERVRGHLPATRWHAWPACQARLSARARAPPQHSSARGRWSRAARPNPSPLSKFGPL
jgi:hypothetical protein